MLLGFSGSLVSEYFVEELLEAFLAGETDSGAAAAARARLLRLRRLAAARLGPVCGPRQVFDLVTVPLAEALGLHPSEASMPDRGRVLVARGGEDPPAVPALVTTGWGAPLGAAWRDAVRAGVAPGAWCLCVNGRQVRLIDARRSYARRFVQFDLDLALEDARLFAAMWGLLHRDSFQAPQHDGSDVPPGARIERIIEASDVNTLRVCRSLRDGVLEALGRLLAGFLSARRVRRAPPPALLAGVHRQSLTIIYRVLFLLFAESRRLVPAWHPVYRDGYSLEAARTLAERDGPATGLWEMLQAIARLSHAGCRAGDLRVTPFNGRLFSPIATPLGETALLDDESARRMLLALSTTPREGGRARIVYRDLDVEQLGAVYESVLDYVPRLEPGGNDAVSLQAGSGVRKATASFYTPRALTTYLVRRTLAPLVAGASPEAILALRLVDPAMGSGAFLVAACRYLASAYEAALVESGRMLAGEVEEADRRAFRRAVAQRCLYGVDRNPAAAQLARLSLWLATLAPDRPLTFLDHRLVVGDSLVGAGLDDLRRRPAPSARRGRGHLDVGLPLLEEVAIGPDLRAVLPDRAAIEQRADDSIADVREKERLVSALSGPRSPLARWKKVLDLWCAQSFVPGGHAPSAGLFAALADHTLRDSSPLAPGVARTLLAESAAAAQHILPLHWTLEFPEVFYGADGSPLERPGFDAVVGNPPWDMIRADNEGVADRADARVEAAHLFRFARDSGVYREQGDGHANRFQLFVERAFQLVRRGGRVGLVVPWGLLGDHGCQRLRRMLFDRTTVDGVVGFDNADRIFPIHRSVRFVAFSATSGGRTATLPTRFGVRNPSTLDALQPEDGNASDFPIGIARGLLDRLSGDSLGVPDVRDARDLQLLEKLARACPAVSSSEGWRAQFGRELNASDDRAHLVRAGFGLRVLEGKHIDAFRLLDAPGAARISLAAARTLLDAERTFERSRLAYRDVSSPTNRLTLIAAIVPAGCVTVHTLFCLRTPLPPRAQLFLCGIFNSFVANYFVRFWVSSHVTTAIVSRLPVPVLPPASASYRRVARLSSLLARTPDPVSHAAYPRLQAEVARLYGLCADELRRMLDTFPLIPEEVRERTMREFGELKNDD